jgi:hypothetical protein
MRLRSFLFATIFAAGVGCTASSGSGGRTGRGGAGGASTGGSSGASGAGGGGGTGFETGQGGGGAGAAGNAGVVGTGGAGAAGAGGGAAGVGDAGASDAGSGPGDAAGAGIDGALGGASKCAGSTFQLCEDFESGALDTATWSVQGTAPTIDGTHVARGAKALHILDPNGAFTKLTEKKTFREPNDTYFARMFIYFKSLPMPTASFNYSHWTMVGATGDGPGSGGEIRLGGQMLNGVNLWGVGTDNQSAGGTGDWTNIDQDRAPDGKPAYVPTGRWLCIEWMHAGPDTNETKFWWDGVEHTSIATTETQHGTKLSRAVPSAGTGNFILPNFTAVWIGWQDYSPGGQTYEMWIDEIAIDHARIGCEN